MLVSQPRFHVREGLSHPTGSPVEKRLRGANDEGQRRIDELADRERSSCGDSPEGPWGLAPHRWLSAPSRRPIGAALTTPDATLEAPATPAGVAPPSQQAVDSACGRSAPRCYAAEEPEASAKGWSVTARTPGL